MRTRCRGQVLAAVAVGVGDYVACSRPARLAADLVITRANIWTGNPLQPDATAVAIIGDRIVEVGGADEIERWRGANTTVIDAEGRRLDSRVQRCARASSWTAAVSSTTST